MYYAVLAEGLGVVLGVVQAHHVRHVQLLEYRNVVERGHLEIAHSVFGGCVRTREGDQFLRHYHGQVAIVYVLIVFVVC